MDPTSFDWNDWFHRNRHVIERRAARFRLAGFGAQDLVQEVLHRLLKHENPVRLDAQAHRLFEITLEHVTIDLRRREKARKRGGAESHVEGDVIDDVHSPHTGPFTGAVRRENAVNVKEALEKLPVLDREVLLGRSAEQASWEEVAKRCGLKSADAARMRFQRALERLRRELENDS